MKTQLTKVAAVLLVMAGTLTTAPVAFADDHGSLEGRVQTQVTTSQHHGDDSRAQEESNQNQNQGGDEAKDNQAQNDIFALLSAAFNQSMKLDFNASDDRGHGKGKGHGQPKPDKAAHQAQLQQLKAAIDQLHKDQQAEQTAHRQLVNATHQFVTVMKSAMQSGNTQAVQDGMTGMQSILQQLTSAMSAQSQAKSAAEASVHAGQHGDMTKAISAIQAADARLLAKTKAMTAAVNALTSLTTKLQGEIQTQGSSSTSTTTDNNTVVNEGNVNVTVQSSSNNS